jgi:hypothetical protein
MISSLILEMGLVTLLARNLFSNFQIIYNIFLFHVVPKRLPLAISSMMINKTTKLRLDEIWMINVVKP